MYSSERGNILFLILLAVILFAALSYAVTHSLRGGGKDTSEEKVDLLAAQIIQTGTMVEAAVQRALLTGGAPDYGLDFNDGTGPSAAAANATCQKAECRIFNSTAGVGQMIPIGLPVTIIDPNSTSPTAVYISFHTHGVGNVGTDAAELVMWIRDIRSDICLRINEKLWGQALNPHHGLGAGTYSGTLTSMPSSGGSFLGSASSFYMGKPQGCFGRSGAVPAVGGHYYHVLKTY